MIYISRFFIVFNWIISWLMASMAVIGIFTTYFIFNAEILLTTSDLDWQTISSAEWKEFGWKLLELVLYIGFLIKIIEFISSKWQVIGEVTLNDIVKKLDLRQWFTKSESENSN